MSVKKLLKEIYFTRFLINRLQFYFFTVNTDDKTKTHLPNK